mgnify:CR=1 FL=1
MGIVSLDQKKKRLNIDEFGVDNQIVFSYFNKIQASERDETLFKAIYIGVLALMEDRLAAFLSKTQNELGTELESLKQIFEIKKELFYKSAVKGIIAEDNILEVLNEYFSEKKLSDKAYQTGNITGKISRNKTGDIVCLANGLEDKKIVIECKFDKSIRLGDIETRDVFSAKTDSAWNQLLEAKVNRDGAASIIVFDKTLADNSILNFVDSVAFIPQLGFVVLVDSQRGEYSNLIVAYNLAKDIALNAKLIQYDPNILTILIKRIIKDIESHFSIKTLVNRNIETNKEILKQLHKSMLLMEFNQKFLQKFLIEGNLTAVDLLELYNSDEIRDEFKQVDNEIKKLLSDI